MHTFRTIIGQIAFRRLIVLLLIIGILYAWWSLRHQFAHMDHFFFQKSLHGYQGLALYLTNQYRKAATAYRTHFNKNEHDRTRFASSPAEDAILSGDLRLAKSLAGKSLQANRNDLKALLDLSDVAILEGDYPTAHRYIEDAIHMNKNQPDAFLALALTSAKTGKYDDSISSLTLLLRNDTAPFRTSTFLICLETVSDLTSLPSQDRPNTVIALLYRYLRIFDPSNGRTAIGFAQQAITNGDRPEDAYLTIGVVRMKEGKKRRALEAFRSAINNNPSYPLSYWYASKIYGQLGDLPNEFMMIKTAFEKAPHEDFYTQDLGHVTMEKLSDAPQTVTILEQAIVTNPENVMAHHWIGHAYSFMGNYNLASLHFRKAIQLDSSNPAFYEGLATALENTKASQEAAQVLQQAITIEPNRAQTHDQLGTLYWNMAQPARAIPELEQAHQLAPHTGPSQFLCQAYYVEGRFLEASKCLRTMLAFNPNNMAIQKSLHEVELNMPGNASR